MVTSQIVAEHGDLGTSDPTQTAEQGGQPGLPKLVAGKPQSHYELVPSASRRR